MSSRSPDSSVRGGVEPRVVWILARKEVRDALRNRWFILYAICFAALSLGLSAVALAGTGRFGLAGFGRTAASLINLVLFIVPLMGLTVGAGAIAGERERGTLEALLAQPILRVEVLLGKFVGLALALLAALSFGFGATAALLAAKGRSTNLDQYIVVFLLSVVLAWALLSVGLLISTIARKSTLATGVAIFTWLGFVLLGDLGLMGTAMTLHLTTQELLGLALVNPLQVFKLFAVGRLYDTLDMLGPAGIYATQTFGAAWSWMLAAILLGWIVLPLVAASLIFARRVVR